jgi:hypothetical protein
MKWLAYAFIGLKVTVVKGTHVNSEIPTTIFIAYNLSGLVVAAQNITDLIDLHRWGNSPKMYL